MARLARSTVIGYPHHVVQRGNNDRTVFETDADYRRYLDWLHEYAPRYAVDVWAYCLMPNHVHFICVPKADGALARAFNTTHMRYAQYFNGKRAVTGPLWRPRFMSCVLDEPSVHEEVRFIETNPVRAGIVPQPNAYPWSSARSHLTGSPDPVLTDGNFLPGVISDWGAYLSSGGDEALHRRVRERLKTGRPVGDAAFVRTLEGIMGRRLEALPRGRPRKDRIAAIPDPTPEGEIK
jgi:putative transposase